MKFNTQFITFVIILLFACQNDKIEHEIIETPEVNEFFEENLNEYVAFRYHNELVSVKVDSISAFVVLKKNNSENSEIDPNIKMFFTKASLDFFILVNGLFNLELTLIDKDQKYTMKISKNEFANFYKIKFADFADPIKLNEFIKANHTEEKAEKFFKQFVSKLPSA